MTRLQTWAFAGILTAVLLSPVGFAAEAPMASHSNIPTASASATPHEQMALPDRAPTVLPAQPLSQVYAENHKRQLVTPKYVSKVVVYLLALLGIFYIGIKLYAKRRVMPAPGPKQKDAPSQNLLHHLLPKISKQPVKPVVVSRTRLAAGRDIYVLDIADKRIVVGATQQSMTLLCDLTEEESFEAMELETIAEAQEEPVMVDKPVAPKKPVTKPNNARKEGHASYNQIYKKYLPPEAQENTIESKPVPIALSNPQPEEAEVTVLHDYADRLEEYF